MKNRKILYWIVNGLAAALMLLTSIPDLLRSAQAVAIVGHLGYPAYLLPFLGTAKALGVVVLLVPGCHRVKEWAFAGLIFDASGALYSHLSLGDPPSAWMPAVVALLLLGSAYFLYRRQLNAHGGAHGEPSLADGRAVECLP